MKSAQTLLPSQGPLVTRREFLWLSAAAGACAALPLSRAQAMPLRLGLVGLGGRGRAALAGFEGVPGAEIVALCDRDPEALRAASASIRRPAYLVREPLRLFAEGRMDAVLLATPPGVGLELAAAACDGGKDVYLFQPVAHDRQGMRRAAEIAKRRGRQVQIARSTRFLLAPGAASRLAAPTTSQVSGVEIVACLTGPRGGASAALLAQVIDELDFAQSLAEGKPERRFSVGGPGLLPGRWHDERIVFDLVGAAGERRSMTLTLVGGGASGATKSCDVVVHGSSGAVRIGTAPLAPGEPDDFSTFLDTLKRREVRFGTSLQRFIDLVDTFVH
ncbi:MAG TPA: Gfo/Idh/MocA family oxidoreductase [Thermoanaerobaculia bacterium]|nr:Gfo/Idh/MocA family oxidoreductase [Thermoanaerobaculia bacterium]